RRALRGARGRVGQQGRTAAQDRGADGRRRARGAMSAARRNLQTNRTEIRCRPPAAFLCSGAEMPMIRAGVARRAPPHGAGPIKHATAAAVLCAFTTLAASAATAQTRQFSFAYDQPHASAYGVAADTFANKLAELSKGSMTINQYPGAQLGQETQTLQKLRSGDIDFILVATANAATIQP